ncbi:MULTISPECIES: VOC family protein [unclassified Streptomyces]|uniref:VOC family protein n=1 Tax=unclassified Streptomyces TaxID=2593676 RepID=UPI0028780535|nr:VOC family protein [Streptomyces sp. BB1-1-1]WND38890.1 VOC family protein [Streptomyces sp. BB1-1-1]
MAGEPSFFELGVADPERGRVFYGSLFDWALEAGPTGRGFSIGTGGVPGGLHGGDAGASPYVFFRVDDLDAAVARVRKLGGSVQDLGEEGEEDAESVARFGRFALCRDDQGSSFGLHEPPNGG